MCGSSGIPFQEGVWVEENDTIDGPVNRLQRQKRHRADAWERSTGSKRKEGKERGSEVPVRKVFRLAASRDVMDQDAGERAELPCDTACSLSAGVVAIEQEHDPGRVGKPLGLHGRELGAEQCDGAMDSGLCEAQGCPWPFNDNDALTAES